ncbi:hypothetical protein JRO89_XS15G0186400 [Xanthoceras sorbifolium]|uniref:ABC-2 type transporter transmembrane domain-containing protein n=1 Tax=Xanthoceras sorbifolium TaxID=99658 RepID=A0ABQ8H2X4_9ROSI|nr:hypothetical protein JRO89_XS15G0186400 [Xanthoceras sorbifolium]
MTQEDLQLAIQVKKNWTLSWWEQFTIVCRRTFKERCRDYFDKLRLVQALGIAVLLGLLWWKSQIGTEAQLRDQVGLIFYICIFWTSSSIFGAVYVFPFEKIYLVEKRKADMYRPSVYYACSALCDIVAHVFYPTIFMVVVYFMAVSEFQYRVFCSAKKAWQYYGSTEVKEFQAFGLSFFVLMISEKHWPHQHQTVLEFKTVHLIIPVTRPVQSALLR